MSRCSMRPWLALAPSRVTITRSLVFGGGAAIAASRTVMWSANGVAAHRAGHSTLRAARLFWMPLW